MLIKIIAVGKKHEGWIEPGISRYETRLKRPFDVTWVTFAAFEPHGRQCPPGRV